MLGSRRVTGSEYIEVENELDLKCLEQAYRDTAKEFGMGFELDERGDEVVYVLRDPPEGLKERLWKGLEARLEMRVDKTEDYNYLELDDTSYFTGLRSLENLCLNLRNIKEVAMDIEENLNAREG